MWRPESQNVESIRFPSGFNFESSLYICKELLSPSSNYAKAATLVGAELKKCQYGCMPMPTRLLELLVELTRRV